MDKAAITPEQQMAAKQSDRKALVMAIEMLEAIRDGFQYDSWDYLTRLTILKEVADGSSTRFVKAQSYEEMAEVSEAIATEVKRRNPLFVNAYVGVLKTAALALVELEECDERNPSDDPTDEQHEDTPSLEDRGQNLGSYAS